MNLIASIQQRQYDFVSTTKIIADLVFAIINKLGQKLMITTHQHILVPFEGSTPVK
jgi:hypothetical protein